MTAHIIRMRFPVEPAPTPQPALTDDELLTLAILNVSHRVARGSTLTAEQHMSIWLEKPWIVPLGSIRYEFEAIR